MSSSRTTKRKRSKAAVPATSSTRERAVVPEPAQNAATSNTSVSGANDKINNADPSKSITTASKVMERGTDSGKASEDIPNEGTNLESRSLKQSAEKGETKIEAHVAEQMSTTSGNGNSTGKDNIAATSSTADDNTNSAPASTLVSIDASSSCTSSQDGASTRRQALHVANDDENREKRMLDLISHRSVLLERVRACRASAENRIGVRSKGINNAIHADDLADDKEIAAFRSMTKQANQSARKNREADNVGEKRTSLSLRRGSSVGKRMNAALSSLVPGSNVTGTTGAGVNTPTAGQTTTTIMGKYSSISNPHSTESKSEATDSSPPFTKYSATKSSGRLPINNLATNSFSTSTTQPTATSIKPNLNSKANKAYSPFPSQTMKQSDGPTRGRPPNSKNAKMMKMGALQIGTAAAQNSFAAAQNLKKNSALPLGARSASLMTATSHPHLLAAKQGPKVNFREAIILREKRDQIELKLQDLAERTQKDSSMKATMLSGSAKIMSSSSLEEEHARRKATPGGIMIAKSPSNKKLIHPAINQNANCNSGPEISPPAHLPNRRRTHWDTVLQEMTWLASDFMEERKWKLSTCRLLSSNIPVHGLSDRRKRSSEANRAVGDGTAHELPSDDKKKNSGASSTNDAPENHNRGARMLKKKHARRQYSALVRGDEEMAKCRSRILSKMISQLDIAIRKGGSLAVSDKYHQEALEHFLAYRSDVIRSAENCKDAFSENDFNIKRDAIKDSKVIGRTDEKKDQSSRNGPSFDGIDDYIDHFHSICKSKHKLAAKETAKALKCGKIKFCGKQKEMLEFVDKVWSGKPHSGAVIFGSSISGITFGTATVVWKQRIEGFQILICPSRSLIRWKYELNRFSNMRVLTFGSTGGISNPESDTEVEEIQSMDVILCEYSSVSRLKNALKEMGMCPFSVIVDLRHFFGLHKSLRASTSAGSKDFPLELLSNSWWEGIVALVREKGTRCLLLEYYDSDPLSLSKSGLGQKEQISILAKRAACIIGPEVFGSSSHSIEREVIAWARKKGKNDIVDKASRVRKILQDAINPMCFRLAKPIVPNFDIKWELRSCKMSTAQRREYERCCYEVRGALSSAFEESNSNGYHYSVPVVSNALFRLRRECSYSRIHAMESHSISHDKSSTIMHKQHEGSSEAKKKSTNFWVNASQPDADKANSILNNSSKLKELISIITSEGGYNLNFDENTKKVLGILTRGKKLKEGKRSVKKIVIFAAIPSIQRLISTLLNLLGIQNELLCRYEAQVKNENRAEAKCSNLDQHTKKYEAIAWARSQSILSRLCNDDHCRKTNIIIASPAALSGRNDGIGIEGADMIITLDSDWSGRDGFIVNSLVKRWHAKNKLVGKEDKLIRLVCADSIEEKIFQDSGRDVGALSWPLDIDGFFTLPISQDEALALYIKLTEDDSASCCSFPAVGVLQNRGYLLKDVLATSGRLPSLFGSGKPAIFLPRRLRNAPTQPEITAELYFLRFYLQNEQVDFVSTRSTPLAKPSMTSKILSAGLISRKDMAVIESRLFLEKLINSYSTLKSKDLDDHPSTHASHSNVLLLSTAQGPGESSSPKIDENPSSLLFYEQYHEFLPKCTNAKRVQSALGDGHVENKIERRYNAYAKMFSSSWNGVSVRDGNQGCEPLVFFPPLFPLLEEVSKKARIQYASSTIVATDIQGTDNSIGNSENNSAAKRKDRDFSDTHNEIKHDSKRPKIQALTKHDRNGYPGPISSLGMGVSESSSKATSNFKDQMIAPNGKAQTGLLTSEKGSKCGDPYPSGRIMVGEDFGLLGFGAFPSPIDAISFSAHDAKANSSYISTWNRPDYGSYQLPCDAEETNAPALKHMDEGIQSVLLFVKKRPRSTQTVYKHGQGLSSIVPSQIGSKSVGDESGKKLKKRGSPGNPQFAPTAFTRLAGNSGTQHSQVLPRTSPANPRQAKGDFRHKLLGSFYSRQRATGLTLFDSISYRIAAMRVEKRVMERLEKLMWKSTLTRDAGPGLPMQLAEKLYSVDKNQRERRRDLSIFVGPTKDGSLPDGAARTQSSSQKRDFEKSSVSPRCVDFGTFQVGYLASPSGMTGIPRARFRVGVSLPMGVKVMQPTKDQEKRSAWNASDDKILEDAVKKFGMNWLLVASATSGFEHAVIKGNVPAIENIVPPIAKSARQCRDRWQLLAQNHASLSKNQNIEVIEKKVNASIYSGGGINMICKSGDVLNLIKKQESSSNAEMLDADQKESAKNRSIMNAKQSKATSPRSTVDKEDDDAANGDHSIHAVSEKAIEQSNKTADVQMSDAYKDIKKKRRSFSAISIARSRRQVFPITIPGVDVGGNQAGHPVPSHPSHMQSVQISVQAQWASGRAEMWPLQILDLADKQRSGATRINNMQRGEIPSVHNPPRRHPTGSSSYQHRPQPPQSSAVRAPVGYSSGMNTSSRPVAPRPVNASATPHHQHRNPQVAAATVQAYIPPQTTATGKPKKSDKKKPTSKTSPKKG